MKTSKDLRLAAKKVYESLASGFSECYDLEGLKEIRFIFIASDAPRNVIQMAYFLQNKVKEIYSDIDPQIIKTSPLFNKEEDKADMAYKALDEATKYMKKHEFTYAMKSVILVPSDMVYELLHQREKLARIYTECYIPALICDVDSLKDGYGAFDKTIQSMNVLPKTLAPYEPYHKKTQAQTDIFVVLASGYECWDHMIDMWFENTKRFGKQAKIAYIDDIEQWTSKKYADQIFVIFEKLMKKSKISVPIEKFPPYSAHLVVGNSVSSGETCTVCIPQSQSHWYYMFKQASTTHQKVNLFILPQEFDSLWCTYGAIGRQFFCQRLRKLAEIRGQKSDLSLLNLHKRFSNWNLRLFWWNFKICLKNYCWISYMSR